MTLAAKYTTSMRVRNYHIDSYGHVNNAQYLTLLEEARTRFMEDIGSPLEGFIGKGIYILVTGIDIKFKKPAVLGDQLEISVWMTHVQRTKVVFRQEIRRAGSSELVAAAAVTCGCIQTGRITAIPVEFLQTIEPYYIP